MMRLYELTTIFIKIGFCSTFLINMTFIYLTISCTQQVFGTYRNMLVMFAATCIASSAIEVIAEPFVHNFNGGLIYFSLKKDSIFSKDYLKVFIIIYASFYVAQHAFIVIQLIYRYTILIEHPLRSSFHGWKQALWHLYYIAIGILYGLLATLCMQPDDYSDQYMRDEMSSVYRRDINDTPRLLAVVNDKGTLRWKTAIFYRIACVIFGVQYAAIIFCAVRMHKTITTTLKTFSARNRKLERQFFKALSVQILLPTAFLTVPVGFVIIVPLLDVHIGCQSGVIYALYSFYPSLDSLATMLIIKEYSKCIKKKLRELGGCAFREDDSSGNNAIKMANVIVNRY